MSAIGAIPAAPRIPNRKGDSVGASGAGGLKTCNTTIQHQQKYMRKENWEEKESYEVESLYESVE